MPAPRISTEIGTSPFFGVTLVTVGARLPEVTDPKRHGGGNTLGAGTFSRVPGQRPSEDERAIAVMNSGPVKEMAMASASGR